MKTPTWGELEAFLKIDGGWKPTRSSKHVFYEKALASGDVLHAHISHARDKTMHPDTFKLILAYQLKVSEAVFWETLSTRRPPARPDAGIPRLVRRPTLSMFHQLRDGLHLSEEELEDITFEEARRRLDDFYSRPR